jgi:LPS-assembly lipoprotein
MAKDRQAAYRGRRMGPIRIALLALSLALCGCGFKPLYAVETAGGEPALQAVNLAGLEASERARPLLMRALARHFRDDGEPDAYDLFVTVRERSQPLAVQIDESVTRFNYRLDANYTLTERANGRSVRGRVDAVASFNVVNSQYSTLYAEESAREKASRVLAEELERDILLKVAAAREAGTALGGGAPRP